MTFAEFEQLPDPQFGRYEFRQGEPVIVGPPIFGHMKVQQMLRDLLDQAAGRACTEFGFRPVPEHEYRIADVGYCSTERWNAADPKGYFAGAPDLAVEILSPSNSKKEMLDKRKLCLENGSLEFWVVDIEHRQIEVSTQDGRTITFESGQQIPLFFTADAHLDVDMVFA
jgi:Uma2 family endonuclease